MSDLRVSGHELGAAATLWTDQADVLHGAAGTLDEAEVACLAPRVQPVAATFLDAWGPVLDEHETTARENGQSLLHFLALTYGVDGVVSDELTGLLPHGAGS